VIIKAKKLFYSFVEKPEYTHDSYYWLLAWRTASLSYNLARYVLVYIINFNSMWWKWKRLQSYFHHKNSFVCLLSHWVTVRSCMEYSVTDCVNYLFLIINQQTHHTWSNNIPCTILHVNLILDDVAANLNQNMLNKKIKYRYS